MATADLSFDMRINGTPEEVASILEVMFEYNEGKNGAYFSCTSINIGDKRFSLSSGLCNKEELMAAVSSNSGTVEISALGPFGKYYEIDDVDILRDMAKAAPNAHFTASITGFAGYADQSLSAELSGGKMHVSTFYLSDDARGDAQSEYFSKYLPYEKFIEIFQLDNEQLDEESFEGFILDVMCDYDSIGEYFEEIDYDRFVEDLSNYEAECFLSEEEYEEAAQQFIDMDCVSFEEFLENEDYAQCDEYTFDPADESNSGNGSDKLKMMPGVAYSINDQIREYLDSIGHPSDDETINNLSVEDVYSIMAGTYGKDSSDGSESAEEITVISEEEAIEEDEAEEITTEEEVIEEAPEEAVEEITSEEVTAETAVETEEAEEAPAEEAAGEETSAEKPTVVETAKNESKPSAPKKASRPWLVLLIVIIVLICLAACALVFCEPLRTYVMELLNIAAQLL